MTVKKSAAEWTTSIPEAGRKYYGLGRNAAYEAAKRGEFPLVEVGRLKRVLVKVLERRLTEEPGTGDTPEAA